MPNLRKSKAATMPAAGGIPTTKPRGSQAPPASAAARPWSGAMVARLARRSLLSAAAALALLAPGARALDYPTRPVHWIPPGGGVSNAINTSLFSDLSFDFLKEIAPVSGLVAYPLVIELDPKVPARTIAELIALAKASPGRMMLASYGTGTISQVAGELFKMRAGIELVHIPYKGGAPLLTDLLSGQVEAANVVASDLPHMRTGAVRPLAVLSAKRIDALPDVPALTQTFAGYEAVAFAGTGAPRGTPPAIVARLNRDVNACLVDEGIKKRIDDLTVLPLVYTPDAFGAYLAAETEKWAKVIKAASIKVK